MPHSLSAGCGLLCTHPTLIFNSSYLTRLLQTSLNREPAARGKGSCMHAQGCSCNTVFVQYVAANRGYTAKTLAVGAHHPD